MELNLMKDEYLIVCDNIKEEMSQKDMIKRRLLKSYLKHIKETAEEVKRLHLCQCREIEFMSNAGIKWVENLKNNDPELFVEWLKKNKNRIMTGRSELGNLPSDFTMDDYYFYVKEECLAY